MGSDIKDTVWPDRPVPDSVKKRTDRFFSSLDTQDSNVGDILADEIFASDGRAQFGGDVFMGVEGTHESTNLEPCHVTGVLMYIDGGAYHETIITIASTIFLANSNSRNKEIYKGRDNAWATFNGRRHVVLRVYSSNDVANDVPFIALVAMDFKNGE
ncbi:hypothetical protein COCMIDRAFT_5801 [Bipolaris oryzae ATCC 44560]|uniref:Uncharacterized protein n=1 Tax=Bipolaris oryzae ATCC 44560 TaxID=930090 RepID=W6Z5A9_COCMI|nr:uncharacterized protein COCMIDRAFT_5801 [Bipolaris oryzae ATCC 44560]EUC44948.1 hypothetical protein COCMIDRAFT_5801 [Bipolaris oryzae ATCC 44560]